MAKWSVFGIAYFGMEVPDADSEAAARMIILNKLMNVDGVKIDIQELDAELAD